MEANMTGVLYHTSKCGIYRQVKIPILIIQYRTQAFTDTPGDIPTQIGMVGNNDANRTVPTGPTRVKRLNLTRVTVRILR